MTLYTNSAGYEQFQKALKIESLIQSIRCNCKIPNTHKETLINLVNTELTEDLTLVNEILLTYHYGTN
jgi:hypothetical protein